MKKRMFAALLAVIMVFALSACTSTSSSTTTVTTSVTDSEGNTTTTTNTTTTESGPDGVTTTHETTEETTTAEEAEAAASEEEGPTLEEIAEVWHENFSGGAKGTSKDGDEVYIAFDDLDMMMYARIMDIIGGEDLIAYQGEVIEEDDHYVLYSESTDKSIAFTVTENDGETFVMTFLGDGDVATMTVVDEDTIIDDMVNIWADFAA